MERGRDARTGRRESKAGRVRERAQAATWRHGRIAGVAFGPPRSGLVLCPEKTHRVNLCIPQHIPEKLALTGKTGLTPRRYVRPSPHGKCTRCVFQSQWRKDLDPRACVFVRLFSIGSPVDGTITRALRWSNPRGTLQRGG
jgi:hypothetical protein